MFGDAPNAWRLTRGVGCAFGLTLGAMRWRMSPLRTALLPSLLIHAGLLAWVSLRASPTVQRAPALRTRLPVEVSLAWESASFEPPVVEAEGLPGRRSAGMPTGASGLQHGEDQRGTHRRGGEQRGEAASAQANLGSLARHDAPTGGAGLVVARAEASPRWDQAPAADGPVRGPRAAPRLSLEQLGVGNGSLFWTPPGPAERDQGATLTPEPAGAVAERKRRLAERKRRLAERKLQLSMQQATVVRDGELGLGPEGPILVALRQQASASLAPNNGQALFLATVDSAGAVRLRLLEANGGLAQWQAVAERAAAALAGRLLELPLDTRGLELEIRVASRVQLPSGRDPGLAVDLLGQRLKEGQGKNSSSISLLEPTLKVEEQEVPMPSGDTIELPKFAIGLNLLGLNFDPVDIGAKSARLVHVQVVRRRAL